VGGAEEASGSPARGPLTEAELALFDPFSREEGAGPSPTHMGELAAMEAESERLDQEPWEPGGQEEEESEKYSSGEVMLTFEHCTYSIDSQLQAILPPTPATLGRVWRHFLKLSPSREHHTDLTLL